MKSQKLSNVIEFDLHSRYCNLKRRRSYSSYCRSGTEKPIRSKEPLRFVTINNVLPQLTVGVTAADVIIGFEEFFDMVVACMYCRLARFQTANLTV